MVYIILTRRKLGKVRCRERSGGIKHISGIFGSYEDSSDAENAVGSNNYTINYVECTTVCIFVYSI